MEEQTGIIWKDRKHHLWFPWSFTKYYIQNDRLMIQKGFLSTSLDETLLYRVMDITMHQSLAGKIFGTGNLIIKAHLENNSEMILENIANPFEVRNMMSDLVEESRQQRNVVGKEFYTGMRARDNNDVEPAPDFDANNDISDIDEL